jgi:hypothetical protein
MKQDLVPLAEEKANYGKVTRDFSHHVLYLGMTSCTQVCITYNLYPCIKFCTNFLSFVSMYQVVYTGITFCTHV